MAGGAMLVFGISWLVFVASLMILSNVLILVLPRSSFTAARTIGGAPWKSLGLGFALLIGAPVTMAILAATVIGISLSVVAGAVYLSLVAFGFFVSAIALGRFGAQLIRWNGEGSTGGRIAVLGAGLLVLSVTALVPVLGFLSTLAALVFGIGALTLVFYRARTAPSTAPLPAASSE
jgi:hypothetical protein